MIQRHTGTYLTASVRAQRLRMQKFHMGEVENALLRKFEKLDFRARIFASQETDFASADK